MASQLAIFHLWHCRSQQDKRITLPEQHDHSQTLEVKLILQSIANSCQTYSVLCNDNIESASMMVCKHIYYAKYYRNYKCLLLIGYGKI